MGGTGDLDRHHRNTPGDSLHAGPLGISRPLSAQPVPRDPAAQSQNRTNEQSDNPANDASGKTKLEHRKQSGRRMNEEPNYQPNDRSDRTSGSGSNYCPMYGRRLCAPGGRKFAWRRPNRTFTFGASVHGNLPSGASTRMVPGYPTTPGSGRRRREAESVKGMP